MMPRTASMMGSATLPGRARPRVGRAEKRVRAPTKARETRVSSRTAHLAWSNWGDVGTRAS